MEATVETKVEQVEEDLNLVKVEAVKLTTVKGRGRPAGSKNKKMGKPAGKKSAYTYFVQAEKEIWQQNNPDKKIAFGDFMKECGAKWKTLDEEAKEPFAVKAAADARRYEAEMVDYVPEAGERGAKKRKVKKDPNAPKRPQTAFFLFAADFRAEVRAGLPDGSTVGEVAKELGRRWGSLGDDEKSKYQQASEKNKAQYEKDMEAYNNGLYEKRARHQQGSDGSDDY